MLDRQCLLTSKFGHHGAKSVKSAKMLLSESPAFGDGFKRGGVSIQYSVFGVRDGGISRVRFIDPRTQSAGVGGGVCLQPGPNQKCWFTPSWLLLCFRLFDALAMRASSIPEPKARVSVAGSASLRSLEQSNLFLVSCVSVLIAPNRANRERSMSLYYM